MVIGGGESIRKMTMIDMASVNEDEGLLSLLSSDLVLFRLPFYVMMISLSSDQIPSDH